MSTSTNISRFRDHRMANYDDDYFVESKMVEGERRYNYLPRRGMGIDFEWLDAAALGKLINLLSLIVDIDANGLEAPSADQVVAWKAEQERRLARSEADKYDLESLQRHRDEAEARLQRLDKAIEIKTAP